MAGVQHSLLLLLLSRNMSLIHVTVPVALCNHLAQGISGAKMEKACDEAHITLNKNAVVGDVSAMNPGGVRIGERGIFFDWLLAGISWKGGGLLLAVMCC